MTKFSQSTVCYYGLLLCVILYIKFQVVQHFKGIQAFSTLTIQSSEAMPQSNNYIINEINQYLLAIQTIN